jgi:hypothetical protein
VCVWSDDNRDDNGNDRATTASSYGQLASTVHPGRSSVTRVANGICQMIARRGRQVGIEAWPHRFRHHFSHAWLDRGGAEGDLMELNGWSSPQMLRRYGASARSARAEPVRDELARKAAAAGQSMQAYLLGELSRLAERPSMAEIVRRAQSRAQATGSAVTMDDAVAAVRAARDRQPGS